jgi:hypothetical protein
MVALVQYTFRAMPRQKKFGLKGLSRKMEEDEEKNGVGGYEPAPMSTAENFLSILAVTAFGLLLGFMLGCAGDVFLEHL